MVLSMVEMAIVWFGGRLRSSLARFANGTTSTNATISRVFDHSGTRILRIKCKYYH